MNIQAEKIDVMWLIKRGYTVSSAARKIGLSPSHVYRVLKEERLSQKALEALQNLPPRPLRLRERLKTN